MRFAIFRSFNAPTTSVAQNMVSAYKRVNPLALISERLIRARIGRNGLAKDGFKVESDHKT